MCAQQEQSLIPMIAFQELPRKASTSGRRVTIQEDHRKTIFPASEQPHERLGLGYASFFVQYLDSGLIHHCETAFQQLSVEVIIQWLEIMLRTEDDPVAKCCPADLGSVLFPIFFLKVQWQPICSNAWGSVPRNSSRKNCYPAFRRRLTGMFPDHKGHGNI